MEKTSQPFQYYDARQVELEAAFLQARCSDGTSAPEPTGISEEEARKRVSASVGLALSGGGIRSATFNLGLQRALAKAGKLKEFDFLSTVSGGGYVGSFIGRLYQRSTTETPGTTPAATALDVEKVLASDAAPVLRWLRDNGRYLAPRGLKDRLFAAGIYLRNLLAIHVLLGVTLLAIFLGWASLRIVLPSLFETAGVSYRFGFLADGSGLSPAWILALVFALAMVCMAWAYWMHRDKRSLAWEERIIALVMAALAILALWGHLPDWLSSITDKLPSEMIAAALIIGLGSYCASLVVGLRSTAPAAIRNHLSVGMRVFLTGLLSSVLFALLDDAAYRVFLISKAEAIDTALIGAGLTGAALAALRAMAQAFAARVETRGKKPSRGLGWLINVAGICLLALVAFGWAYVAEVFVWSGLPRGTVPQNCWPVLGAAMTLGILVLLAGRHLDVLNLSSLHVFYTARLGRAYLGPGNPERGIPWTDHPAHAKVKLVPVSKVAKGDDIEFNQYAPHSHGGPLHLVNVNVNQTRYSAGGDYQPDRKGWNLAVGPAGFNLGRSRWQPPGWLDAQPLNLGQWMAISGAAFSTGAGPRTGLGFSALLGLLGVRLGYWWRAGDETRAIPKPHMMRALWNEITGAFDPDESTHWYLSDGGHFENTAAYELIRRRLKRIVVADCGADPEYDFTDLAGLVLKARIDFGAEVQFFGRQDLDQVWQGKPELRKMFTEPEAVKDRYGPSMLLAIIRYPSDPIPGWMMVVKPRLPQQLPTDLAYYAKKEEDFPQQTTLDQFYDEVQWESTHKLGYLLGEQLVQALAALPAWQGTQIPAPSDFMGATWLSEGAAATALAPEVEPSNPAGLLKIYAPIVIALWTGFEFYSNYKQEQAKDIAEKTKFALSRVDTLERQVFGKDGCAASAIPLEACPTIPAQTLLVRQILTELPPNNARPLIDITARIEQAVKIGRPPHTELAGLAAAQSSATGQLASVSVSAPNEASRISINPELRQRALVYIQIYDEERRADAKRMIGQLQQAGLAAEQLPGVENVVRTAQAIKAKTPARFNKLSIIYYHDEDKPLAEWIAQQVADRTLGVELRDLSKSYSKVRKGMVELWLP